MGDTPESDIRGTNEFNKEAENTWYSILVKTGVYQNGTKPKYEPKITVENVLEAVMHGIHRENQREHKKLLKDALNITDNKLNGSALLTPDPSKHEANPMDKAAVAS